MVKTYTTENGRTTRWKVPGVLDCMVATLRGRRERKRRRTSHTELRPKVVVEDRPR
jgi:hypothetical protein